MQIFVIRHAAAVPRGSLTPDAERRLSPKGIRRWQQAVRGLDRLGATFDRLYHSPWLRAVETANALADLIAGETVVTRDLARSPTLAFLDQLEGERVALVGHQPWLGELVGILAFGEGREGARLALRKGSVVWLDGTPRAAGMTIRALLPPRILRALARS
jgi:phosphohistidine phosphatase